MRKLVLLPLLLAAAACDVGQSTQSEAAVIHVRVIDDAGAPVTRTRINVAISSMDEESATTSDDGTASIGVARAGTYEVSVTPRAGYLGKTEPLVRSVTVTPSSSATVEFQIYREALSNEPPDWTIPGL